MNDILYVIIPCYNEEETLQHTFEVLEKTLIQLMNKQYCSIKSKLLFVDDGSKDQTYRMLKEKHRQNSMFSYIRLSRNFGHQYALLAGLDSVKDRADVTITIDADLQQDVNAMESFLDKYNEGYDIVYGVRKLRDTDGFFKRITASIFYGLTSKLGGKIIKNHADYRLLSSKVLHMLMMYGEENLFLRGIIPMCSDNACIVYFDVFPRKFGESKYTTKKMFALALNGITSLSTKPISFITQIGFAIFSLSILISIGYFITYLAGNTVSGWTSLIISIWALGGLMLMSLGIVGEYIGKTYIESKGRPRYIISDMEDDDRYEFLEKE